MPRLPHKLVCKKGHVMTPENTSLRPCGAWECRICSGAYKARYRERKKIARNKHRFESKFIPVTESGCWLWLSVSDNKGYGKYKFERKYHQAHRFSYELANGPITNPRMLVCHKCDTPACINPDHLFLGTHADNMQDMVRKGRSRRRKTPEGER